MSKKKEKTIRKFEDLKEKQIIKSPTERENRNNAEISVIKPIEIKDKKNG